MNKASSNRSNDAMQGDIALIFTSAPPSVNASNATVMARSKKDPAKTVPRRIKTRDFRSWAATAAQEIMIQRQKPIMGPVVIEIEVRRESGRRDVDNVIKGLLDLLVKQHLISDDRNVTRVSATWIEDRAAPACSVKVQPWRPL